jgi:hypothetical protein
MTNYLGLRKSKLFYIVTMILISFIIKGFWIYSNYSIATDISYQMNIAESIIDVKCICIKTLENDSIIYRPSFIFAPGVSVFLAGINYLTKNTIVSDLFLRLLLALWESIIIVLLVLKFFEKKYEQIILAIILSLYIGHIDRGLTADYFSFLLVLSTIYLFISKGNDKTKVCYEVYGISLCILLIPIVKYSAFPAAFMPIAVYLFGIFYLKKNFLFNFFELTIISVATALSCIIFVTLPDYNSVLNNIDWNRIFYFNRVDYFWMHFGHIGDRIWKHFSWNLTEHFGINIPFYHIAQFGTLFIAVVILIFLRKHLKIFKLEFLILGILTVLQIGFLGLLTLLYEPQIGDYGIDKKIWVFIEEARYYNYITFMMMVLWCFYTFRFLKPAFYLISFFIILSTIPRLDFWNSRFPVIYEKYQIAKSGVIENNLILEDGTKETDHIINKILVKKIK